ncbi:hypothetical protein PQ43W_4 [Ralstonia phage PQ43W]
MMRVTARHYAQTRLGGFSFALPIDKNYRLIYVDIDHPSSVSSLW